MQDADFHNKSLGGSAGWVADEEASSPPRSRTVSAGTNDDLNSTRSDQANEVMDLLHR